MNYSARIPRHNRIKQSAGNQAFDVVNYIFMGILVILIVLPLLNLFALAFSNGANNPRITFYPIGFTLQAFEMVFAEKVFWQSVLSSVIITVTVTIGSNLLMTLAAYPLSKPDCPFRKGILTFFIITMLFSAGITPCLILMRMLKLTDTIWSVIVISFLNVFNMLLYKTFFEGIPEEIEEAAKIDGAGGLKLFTNIVIPMSLPVIASCCFFTIVGSWNSYGGALLFIPHNTSQQPLALYIYKILEVMNASRETWDILNQRNMLSACIIISTVPILAIYPYVVRYIKGGLSIGSVKG